MLTSRHFGPIGASDYAEGATTHDGHPVRFDVNLAAPAALGAADLAEVDRAIDELDALVAIARAAFRAAMENPKEQPLQFWEFHRDDVEGYADLTREVFVDALSLARIGFYPDGAFGTKAWVVLDFELRGGERSDQILVAKLSKDREMIGISWES